MPFVRIELLPGRSPDQLRAIADGVHRALIEAIGIPEADRFQVISELAEGRLLFDPGYLGIRRTGGVVFVQITMSFGRTLQKKQSLFAAIARNLSADPGVRPEDVFVNLVEIATENWSFGNGIAQYAT